MFILIHYAHNIASVKMCFNQAVTDVLDSGVRCRIVMAGTNNLYDKQQPLMLSLETMTNKFLENRYWCYGITVTIMALVSRKRSKIGYIV